MFLDTERLAQELYDASLVAREIPLSEISAMLARATPGHETIDEPQVYRWFLIPSFPTKSFGITLGALMKEAGNRASQEKFQHDRIVELLKKGAPVWPAFVTADGIIVDGYHRIAAHRTLRAKTMPVVIAVKKSGGTHWDEAWNQVEWIDPG